MKHLSIVLFVLLALSSFAQEKTSEKFKHTLSHQETLGFPKATIQDVAWIQGHWVGEAFNGVVEEIWSPPLGHSMMCAFKLVVDDEVKFYEICTIIEENKSLILRLKHFDKLLKGWEERNETVDFKLVKLEQNKAFFNGFTFEKVSKKQMNIYVVVESDGVKQEVPFHYYRYNPKKTLLVKN